MIDKFTQARASPELYSKKVVICELVGLQFNKYNNIPDYPAAQSVINPAIPLLNKYRPRQWRTQCGISLLITPYSLLGNSPSEEITKSVCSWTPARWHSPG